MQRVVHTSLHTPYVPLVQTNNFIIILFIDFNALVSYYPFYDTLHLCMPMSFQDYSDQFLTLSHIVCDTHDKNPTKNIDL